MRSLSRLCLALLVTAACWAQPLVTVTQDATNAVQPGDVISIEARGPSAGVATYLIEGQTTARVLVEAQRGLYQAEYTVRRGDVVNGKVITVTIKLADGRVLRAEPANRIGEPLPVAPVIPPSLKRDFEVRGFDILPNNWLKAGGTASFSLQATPGCQATLAVGGLFPELALAERTPGHYYGTWTVPAEGGVTCNQPTIAVRLKKGNTSDVVVWTKQFLGVDTAPPLLLGAQPAADEVYPATINAVRLAYDDGTGSDIDRNASRIILDGTNLASTAGLGDGVITCRLARQLAVGTHRLSIQLIDRAGNEGRSYQYSFEIAAAVAIADGPTVTHNAATLPQPGETVTVTLNAPSKGRATFSLGTAVTDQPMTEVRTGQYSGDYVVRRADKLGGLPVVVIFTDADGRRQQIRAATGIPTTTVATPANNVLVVPTITSPLNNSTVVAQSPIRGTSTPGAKVELTIESLARVAGFMDMRGDPVKVTAVVDADGNWSTAAVAFARPAMAGTTTFTITAVTVLGDKRSDPTIIKVTR